MKITSELKEHLLDLCDKHKVNDFLISAEFVGELMRMEVDDGDI